MFCPALVTVTGLRHLGLEDPLRREELDEDGEGDGGREGEVAPVWRV